MRKYWAFYKTSITRTIAYRGTLLMWLTCNFISLATIMAVWFSAANTKSLGGYTFPQLTTYYILGIVVGWAINWNTFASMKQKIKKGDLATELVKPVSPVGLTFVWEAAFRSICFLFGLAGTIVVGIILSKYLAVPTISNAFLVLPFSFAMAIAIQALLGVCLAMFSFWLTDTESLSALRWIGLEIFGGTGLPLSFIPLFFQPLIRVLPFRYMYSFPMEIIFGKVNNQELIIGLCWQAFWVVALYLLHKILWHQGLKAYVSVGH